MHKKIPKIRVNEAKIYLYHSTEIAKARPHSEEWQTDTSVQKQWSMTEVTLMGIEKDGAYIAGEAPTVSSGKLAVAASDRYPQVPIGSLV